MESRAFRPVLLILPWLLAAAAGQAASPAPIDRQALVSRHDPVLHQVDVDSPFIVGNGGFAFGADITGLQTFADLYQRTGIPTETLARWTWHSEPNPAHYVLADTYQPFTQADGRVVEYPTIQSGPAADWLRRNPQSQPLGQISLELADAAGVPQLLRPGDIGHPEQTLSLWEGVIRSRFELAGQPVEVWTVCHPELDGIAVKIISPLLGSGRLRVRIAFPHGYDLTVKNTPPLDWTHPEAHRTAILRQSAGRVDLERTIDDTRYEVAVAWEGEGTLIALPPHQFRLAAASGAAELKFSVTFAPQPLPTEIPGFDQTLALSRAHWEKFWREGAAVDFSGSADSRATVLEGRIVLSRYLMAAQEAGDAPPQESGLTASSWYGKHHSEMIWWHTAQFALWGDDSLLEKNLAWFQQHLPEARALAQSRGLTGARWAKMAGPEGRESPGGNPLIVWNQPSLIYLCELLYRNQPVPATLARYRDLVLETADCLASMLTLDRVTGEYDLGPPLWIAQEIYDPATSQNPSFELAYWRFGLETAQRWRERLGLPRDARWDDRLARLAPLPLKDGKYVALASHPDTWDNPASRHDHPAMLMPLGVLPGAGVDRATMDRTLDAVLASWDWETKIWGWDYPMIAMTATRLGRPGVAVEILLRDGPNNGYMPNGQVPQSTGGSPATRRREIAAYLPANGALLSAVALMVAGWDGCTEKFPGFPKDGKWVIRSEGLHPLP
jgi:hypothetical protein